MSQAQVVRSRHPRGRRRAGLLEPTHDSSGGRRDDGTMTPPGKLPAPQHGLLLTHFLTVRDVAVSRRFYADVFGGEVVMAENPAMVKVANSWIIMNPGGGPTADKPGITLEAPRSGGRVSSFLNVRVAD